jgi:hypothetical protein
MARHDVRIEEELSLDVLIADLTAAAHSRTEAADR